MDPQQQFCLKWNSYSSNLAMTCSKLCNYDFLADVTLSCNGSVFKAHKLILAACSKKFSDLFETTPTNGHCVVILEATSSENMAALLEFMYKGEVHVSQEALNSFLKSAENLQVKGLSTEHGRLAAAQAQQQEPSLSDSPVQRSNRSNIGGGGGGGGGGIGGSSGVSNSAACGSGNSTNNNSSNGPGLSNIGGPTSNINDGSSSNNSNNNNNISNNNNNNNSGSSNIGASHLTPTNLKSDCADSLMHPSSSCLVGGPLSPYVSQMYRPASFEPPRKRALRSPYAEQELRGSVLRDGSKNSPDGHSPANKPYRPSSSSSSTAPTEPDTMQSERGASPQYENHSPCIAAANCNAASSACGGIGGLTAMEGASAGTPVCLDRPLAVKNERNNGSTNEAIDDDDEREDLDETNETGAEDLRVKMENSSYSPPPLPTSNASPITPNALMDMKMDSSVQGSLASIAPADMLNVWNATKLNNKNSGMVNTADGKKLKCLYCDRLYGYETNLRAHIRQRHQGIRVPCPFCSRTFTRNNTVRRHIAREHKQEIGISQLQQATNHTQ